MHFRKTMFAHMFVIHIIQKTSIYRANLNALLTINAHEHLSYFNNIILEEKVVFIDFIYTCLVY